MKPSPKLPETEWEECIGVADYKEYHPAQGMGNYAYLRLPPEWRDCEVVAYRIRLKKSEDSNE